MHDRIEDRAAKHATPAALELRDRLLVALAFATRISRPGKLAAGGAGRLRVRRSVQPQVNDRDRVHVRRVGQPRDPFQLGVLAPRRAR